MPATPPIFQFTSADSPILISMPHSGESLMEGMADRFSVAALTLPDTDWGIPQLYAFAEGTYSIIKANYSRYVVDLNRPSDDAALYPGQVTTGLCPTALFDGEAIYSPGAAPDAEEIAQRCQQYWQPYHQKLATELQRIKERYGFAILYDAHSIASRVPRLFAGQLPDLNLGTVQGSSCASFLQDAMTDLLATQTALSWVANGRFVGGHITRSLHDPAADIHCLQMEIGRDCYWHEEAKQLLPRQSAEVSGLLARMLEQLQQTAITHYA